MYSLVIVKLILNLEIEQKVFGKQSAFGAGLWGGGYKKG